MASGEIIAQEVEITIQNSSVFLEYSSDFIYFFMFFSCFQNFIRCFECLSCLSFHFFRYFVASTLLSASLPHRLCFPPVYRSGSAFRQFAALAPLSASLPHWLCFPPVCRIGSAFRQFATLVPLSASLSYRPHFYRNNHVTVQANRKTDIRNLLHLLPLPGQVWYDKRCKDICPSKGEPGYDYFK